MEIKNRLYPYPILREGSDDYINSKFTFELRVKEDNKELKFYFKFILKDVLIETLIENDFFEYVVHIECPFTCFRNIYQTNKKELELTINQSQLLKKVNICVFIVAKYDFSGYSNKNFNEDYSEIDFEIEKGNIIAIGGQQNLDITKLRDELENTPSIFTICKSLDKDTKSETLIALDGDKITISLSEDNYNLYNALKLSGQDNLDIINSLIIIPTLIYMFEAMKQYGIENYSSNRWFKSIEQALISKKIELTEETLFEKESYELAQLILENPITRSLQSLKKLNIEEVEED